MLFASSSSAEDDSAGVVEYDCAQHRRRQSPLPSRLVAASGSGEDPDRKEANAGRPLHAPLYKEVANMVNDKD